MLGLCRVVSCRVFKAPAQAGGNNEGANSRRTQKENETTVLASVLLLRQEGHPPYHYGFAKESTLY